ncbi:MAG: hypothetical protein ACE5KU_07020, partial [Nitrososphaerales archaeon]
KENEVSVMELEPRDLGVNEAKPSDIAGLAPERSAELTFRILNGNLNDTDPRVERVMVNAAAGITVGGLAEDFRDGLELAREAIDSGEAVKKLRRLIEYHDGDIKRIEELERKYA